MFTVITTLSNVHMQVSPEILEIGGALATVSLILTSSMALLLVDSKYWNKWTSSTTDMCTYPLLVVFAAIVIFKIMMVL